MQEPAAEELPLGEPASLDGVQERGGQRPALEHREGLLAEGRPQLARLDPPVQDPVGQRRVAERLRGVGFPEIPEHPVTDRYEPVEVEEREEVSEPSGAVVDVDVGGGHRDITGRK
jgi:hypothetical protein